MAATPSIPEEMMSGGEATALARSRSDSDIAEQGHQCRAKKHSPLPRVSFDGFRSTAEASGIACAQQNTILDLKRIFVHTNMYILQKGMLQKGAAELLQAWMGGSASLSHQD